jgi:hypothetical protein
VTQHVEAGLKTRPPGRIIDPLSSDFLLFRVASTKEGLGGGAGQGIHALEKRGPSHSALDPGLKHTRKEMSKKKHTDGNKDG